MSHRILHRLEPAKTGLGILEYHNQHQQSLSDGMALP